jgi:hypothetical protein
MEGNYWAYCIVGGLVISMIAHALNIYNTLKRASKRKDDES